MRRSWIALVVGVVAGAWLAACSARAPKAQMKAEPAKAKSPAHRNIAAIEAEMNADLEQLELAPPTEEELRQIRYRQLLAPALPMSHEVAATCPVRPSGAACGDVCRFADRICHSARRICALADALPGDDWAMERCSAGKLSCERAKARCCDCSRT
jgi:hypothetical protein